MTTVIFPEGSVFQEARNRVQSEIDQILQCLKSKRVEMIAVIKNLEDQYFSKQKQKHKKMNEINRLIAQTEELVDDNILEVQNRKIQDLQNELSIASIQESDCSVEFEWGFSRDVISKINSITLKRLDTDKDEGRAPRKGPPPPPKPKFLRDFKSKCQTGTKVLPESLTNTSNFKESSILISNTQIAGISVGKEFRNSVDLEVGIETHAPAYFGEQYGIDEREVKGGFRGGGNPNRKRGQRIAMGYQRGGGFNQRTADGYGKETFDTEQASFDRRGNSNKERTGQCVHRRYNKQRTRFYGNGEFSKERNDDCEQRRYNQQFNGFDEDDKFSKERANAVVPLNTQKQNYRKHYPQNFRAPNTVEHTLNHCASRFNDKRGEMKSNFQRDARRSGRGFDRNLGGLQKNQGLYRSTDDIRNSTNDIRNVTNQDDDSFANRKLYWKKQATTSNTYS